MTFGTPFARSIRPITTSFSGLHINNLPRGASFPSIYGIRHLAQSCVLRASHYDTLGVPQNATKGQIKASFYSLSKKYHPDINPATKDKFVAAKEAYTVLHDDRSRRAYDRSLAGSSEAHDSLDASAAWSYDPTLSRRPRATHAWESPRRHRAGHHPRPHQQQHPHQHTTGGYTHASPHARRATGGHGYSHLPREDPNSIQSRLQRDSGVWRVLQVFGVLWVVVSLSGLTVHAGRA